MKPSPMTDEQMLVISKEAKGFPGAVITLTAAARDQQWVEMLAKVEPVAIVVDAYDTPGLQWLCQHPPKRGDRLYTAPPDHTAVMRQALVALSDFDYDKRMVAIAALEARLK